LLNTTAENVPTTANETASTVRTKHTIGCWLVSLGNHRPRLVSYNLRA